EEAQTNGLSRRLDEPEGVRAIPARDTRQDAPTPSAEKKRAVTRQSACGFPRDESARAESVGELRRLLRGRHAAESPLLLADTDALADGATQAGGRIRGLTIDRGASSPNGMRNRPRAVGGSSLPWPLRSRSISSSMPRGRAPSVMIPELSE